MPEIEAVIERHGWGSLIRGGLVAFPGRNENWDGITSGGVGVFIKKIDGPDAPARFDRALSFTRLARRATDVLGMAHGITGPLAALCSALNHRREVEGQRNAIEHITRWLLDWLLHDDAGPYWPAPVSLAQQTARQRDTSAYTRNAWCYGSPGVAAAVHHVGVALRLPDWCRTAITVLNAALARDQDQWELEGPTPYADSQADFTFRRLITTTPAGTPTEGPPLALNAPGMLEGAAGIACALLSTTRARDDHRATAPGTDPSTWHSDRLTPCQSRETTRSPSQPT
ncbi:lanthionine synthetase LanC family protein [Streptomyces sp. NPDC091376]|uniref:lanthionine synthetase LanC family protein n=1 Tax=Streptomyces sp. NPDC091376 TaxID=3365994 RepID=UPI0038013220